MSNNSGAGASPPEGTSVGNDVTVPTPSRGEGEGPGEVGRSPAGRSKDAEIAPIVGSSSPRYRAVRGWIRSPEGVSWLLAALVSATISAGIAYVFHFHAIPPGGDPGTWLATARAYVGINYSSQTVPLAYPPALFPFLGLAIVGTGSPVTAAQVFAPTLYFVLGLSVFFLATRMLQSRTVALVVLTFTMIDPQLVQMVFWGAYPNLLGFVFLYLSIAGLVLVGKGDLSRGAALFWGASAMTVLTHSLTALVLAGTVLLTLVLSFPLWWNHRSAAGRSPSANADSPANLLRGLFRSRGGVIGLFAFAIAVGAFYVVTALTKVTHPDYFVSSSLAFQVIGLGSTFRALFPGFRLASIEGFYLLVLLVIALLMFYALALEYRPAWLTTSLLLLLANGTTVLITPVGGWILRIVTDYARFSFFIIVPTALSLGYLIDRGWICSARGAQAPPPPADPKHPEPVVRRWLRRSRHPRRTLTLALLGFVLGILIAATITAPALGRFERAYTGVGHDHDFVDALNAIEQTGTPGNILTIQGADKWARAITNRNTFAPYAQASLLFYQTQVIDSELAYYALASHFAVTNGLVSGLIRGTVPSVLDGIPDYGINVIGANQAVLSIPPGLVSVILVGATNHTPYRVGLTGSPTVSLPPFSGGGPMVVTFTEPRFVFTVDIALVPDSPQLDVAYSVVATSADLVRSFNLTIVPAEGLSAKVWPAVALGGFDWVAQARAAVPVTIGAVSPTSGLKGVTTLDPETSTPAVTLSFNSSGPAGAQVIPGSLNLTTPGASTLIAPNPEVVLTPQVWSQFGIRFILMTNATYDGPAIAEFPNEVQYLETEYGLPVVYQNAEWSVLETPP